MECETLPPHTQPKYRHILVPLDGSQRAEGILPHVELLAHTFGAAVTLLHATTPPDALVAAGSSIPRDVRPLLEPVHQEVELYLQGVAQRLLTGGLRVAYKQQEGLAATVILEVARDLDVDLIAMATSSCGALRRLLGGSVAEEVLQHAPCPMLLVCMPT